MALAGEKSVNSSEARQSFRWVGCAASETTAKSWQSYGTCCTVGAGYRLAEMSLSS